MTLRLLLVDDSDAVRRSVRSTLLRHSGWEICGEAANGRDAVAKVSELSPDVVVLDLSMPVMNGFEAAAAIRRLTQSAKIVFLSQYDIPLTAAQLGGDAYVCKALAAQELISTIERVTQNGAV